ncbi:hypothetical protein BP00DRAFT_9181 [Aspergillus indologenus CBS 114.80]|uniref:Uncharacterized protein n=1 Tax=Aspergillus indologenus CBS 114.80 TaxID=1450541 RepID=A0A2V5ILA0_9EURO|nr:hypothetical protein BP00DRAFT_9181 [Aspergillus indologenus CBS 114.80]
MAQNLVELDPASRGELLNVLGVQLSLRTGHPEIRSASYLIQMRVGGCAPHPAVTSRTKRLLGSCTDRTPLHLQTKSRIPKPTSAFSERSLGCDGLSINAGHTIDARHSLQEMIHHASGLPAPGTHLQPHSRAHGTIRERTAQGHCGQSQALQWIFV